VDRERIREIIRIAQESPIAELCVREGDLEVRVVKAGGSPEPHPVVAHVAMGEEAIVRASDTVTIRSTKVGFFHRGKGPGAAPLVAVGDHVRAGQPLGTLEALRKLAEVTSDVAGTIAGILVEDGSAVEYGQPLFEVRPGEGGEPA
jgi:biotin carboxyl carrier protein